jgi:hypothetical protein
LIVPQSLFRATSSNHDPHTPGRAAGAGIVLIFLLGVAVRLFACGHTYIISPDGVYYIHQARAIYYGEWHNLTSCCLSFVSSYPFFIAGAYPLIHEWVAAAQLVSLLFGSMTLVPLYLLCRRFFTRDVSALTLLVVALLPLFVIGSGEVIRDPVCWFFLSFGLYFFVASYEKKFRLLLLFSCLSFLMATWARVESFLFILVSFIFLLLVPQEQRIKRLAWFAMPLISALILIFCAVVFLDQPLLHTLRVHDMVHKLWAPIISYEVLRTDLAELMKQPLEGVIPHFLHKARNMVWLVALGTVVRYMIRAYFYLFFIFFVLGLGGMRHRLREDRRILYLCVLSLSVVILFYVHVLQTWMMFDRFWAIFIIPAFVVMGFGVHKARIIMIEKWHLNPSIAFFIMCLLILVCTLPKDLRGREADKMVYKRIGEHIAEREGGGKEIRILKSLRTPNWTPFYANLGYEGVSCPMIDFGMEAPQFEETVFKDYDAFVHYLRKGDIGYFLWEETAWPEGGFNFLDRKHPDHLKEMGSWHHADAGRLILYQVVKKRSDPSGAIPPLPAG